MLTSLPIIRKRIDKAYFIGLPTSWLVVNLLYLPSTWNAGFHEWSCLLVTTTYAIILLEHRQQGNYSRVHYFILALYIATCATYLYFAFAPAPEAPLPSRSFKIV